MAHHHFTRDDRVFLAKLLSSGLSARAVARILGFHPSSVYRELSRGKAATTSGYSVRTARKRAQRLRANANQQHRKLGEIEATQLLMLIRQYYKPRPGRTGRRPVSCNRLPVALGTAEGNTPRTLAVLTSS